MGYLHVLSQVGAVFTAIFRQFNWSRAVMITQNSSGVCTRGVYGILSGMLIFQTIGLFKYTFVK